MYKFGMYQIEFQMFWFIYQQNSHHRNLEDGSSPEVTYGPNMPTSSMLPSPSSLSSIGGGPSPVGLGPSMLPSPSSLSSIGGGSSPVGLGPSMLPSPSSLSSIDGGPSPVGLGPSKLPSSSSLSSIGG